MHLSKFILSLAMIGATMTAMAASVSYNENLTEEQQMQASAKEEAVKHLLTVDAPYYDPKDHNQAVVRVEGKSRGRTNYCLIMMNKLLVPGATEKGIWVPTKSQCK